jgi:hypothetical protein
MPNKIIEFYELIKTKEHKAFWVTQDNRAMEFMDRNIHAYPLDDTLYKRLELPNVKPDLLKKLKAAGIDPVAGKLILDWPSKDLNGKYKVERKQSEIVIDKIFADMQMEIDKNLRKRPLPIALAKYHWEFLRRSNMYQADCRDLLDKRAEFHFETVWVDGSPIEFDFEYPYSRSVDFYNFIFAWEIYPIITDLCGLLFLCYEDDFRELLVNMGITILLNKKDIALKINRWAKKFVYSGATSTVGYPGGLFNCKIVGPNSNMRKSNTLFHTYHIEFNIIIDKNKLVNLQESLSKLNLCIFSASDCFLENDKCKITFNLALPGFPKESFLYSGKTKAPQTFLNKYLPLIKNAVIESVGVKLPFVDPGNEMRYDALDYQLEFLDEQLGWLNLKLQRDNAYYRYRKPARDKINKIETAASRRKKLIKF